VPEKTVEWLQAEALRRCRTKVGCRHLEAVFIRRTKPEGSRQNWNVLVGIIILLRRTAPRRGFG